MKLKNLCTIVAATAAFTLGGIASGQAVTFEWTSKNTGTTAERANWLDATNWNVTSGTPPTPAYPHLADHKAIIKAPVSGGEHPLLDVNAPGGQVSVTVGSLAVESSGFLSITNTAGTPSSSARLVLTDTGAFNGDLVIEVPGTAGLNGRVVLATEGRFELASITTAPIVAGDIVLSAASSRLLVMDDMTFGPDGSSNFGFIIGQHNDAQIRIASGKTLTSEIMLNGAMEIVADSGTATLKNLGVVEADAAGGTLTLGGNLILEDNSGALWAASGNCTVNLAVLEFNKAATGLSGKFEIDDCGEIHVRKNIWTTNALVAPRLGAIETFDNESFIFDLGHPDNEETLIGRHTYGTCPCL